MPDFASRAAVFALLACGALTLVSPWGGTDLLAASGARGDLMPALQHRLFMIGLLGSALLLAVVLPALRLPAVAAGLLSKAGFVAIALTSGAGLGAATLAEAALAVVLALAGWVFLAEARQDARWHARLQPEA